MGIISGNDAKLQMGVETTWGTSVAPTLQLSFTSETLRYIPNYQSEDALVGNKTTSRMDPMGQKVEGDISTIVKPDEIGLLLAWAMGAEGDAAQVDTSTAYTHDFTLIESGSSNSLPKATFVVDRKVDVFGYVSCKCNSFSLEAAVNDYLRATWSVIGYDEDDTDALEALTGSTLKAFKFKDGSVTVDGSDYADITSFDIQVSNNLENDLYTMGSGDYMNEIEPQAREVSVNMEVLYSTTSNTTRSTKFKQGATAAVVATFTSDEVVEVGYPYEMTITLPLVYITEANPNVSGPDRIRMTLSGTATEDASNEAITIQLQDDTATKFIV